MKKFFTGIILSLMLAMTSVANAGLISWDDIDDGTVEVQAGATYLTNGIFSWVPPVMLFNGTDGLSFLANAAGYTQSTTGNVEHLSQIWDFSNGIELLFGLKLDVIFEVASQVGDTSNIIGTARLSDDTGYVDLLISGIHTNVTNAQGFQYGTFAGLLSVDNSNVSNPGSGATDVPEPGTLAIFAIGMLGLVSRKLV